MTMAVTHRTEGTDAVSRLAAIEANLGNLQGDIERRIKSVQEAASLALTAQEKTTSIAQQTADRAVAKAEAAAGKEYLESQIAGLRDTLTQQIIAQKEAISAALTAAQAALTAALMSSEKAIHKAEESTEKRFQSVNEFRAQLADQQNTFVVKSENEYRFVTIDKKLDEISGWQRENDLKFGKYVLSDSYERNLTTWTDWRRTVDSALTAASSKNATIYSAVAIAIAIGTLVIAMFNLVMKAPVV